MAKPTIDPFYLVKDDIQSSLEKAQGQFARWQQLSKSNLDRKRLEGEIDDECRSIAWQVDEMEKAVDVAEKNMSRFGLTQAEISSRRKWVLQTRRQCEGVVATLEAAQRPEARVAETATPTAKLHAAALQDNDRFLASEGDQQQLLLRQQDDELDQLGRHVERIGQVGLQIHEELEVQDAMLTELDEDVAGAQSRLAAAQKKMAGVLKRMGMRGQLCIMCVLLLLLIILFAILFGGI